MRTRAYFIMVPDHAKLVTRSKSRHNNKRDDHYNKSDYILINWSLLLSATLKASYMKAFDVEGWVFVPGILCCIICCCCWCCCCIPMMFNELGGIAWGWMEAMAMDRAGGSVLGTSKPLSFMVIILQAKENSLMSICPSPLTSAKPLQKRKLQNFQIPMY